MIGALNVTESKVSVRRGLICLYFWAQYLMNADGTARTRTRIKTIGKLNPFSAHFAFCYVNTLIIYIRKVYKNGDWHLIALYILLTTVSQQCNYDVITTGISSTDPDPTTALKAVPYFPEYEPDNRKYFRVKSGTHAAIFLSPGRQINNGDTDYVVIS